LKDTPIEERPVPEGLIQVNNDYYYVENPPGAGVRNLGLEGQDQQRPQTQQETTKDEVKNELF
jgi:penicillin-binding protein 1A